MKKINKIVIFVGSPSDTAEERHLVQSIIAELNQTLGKEKGIVIDKIMWEEDVDPTVGEDGQDVINNQSWDNYDIFLGFMWKKFGFPTPRANSATEEEYNHAIESYKSNGHCKDIIILFCNRPIPVDSDIEQLKKVQKFKERVAKDGVFYKTYDNVNDFLSVTRIAIYRRIVDLLNKNQEQKSQKKVVRIKSQVPTIESLDENTKLIFDTLANSPAVNDIKSKFIESYILLFLFDKIEATSNNIISYLSSKLDSKDANLYNGVFGKLNNTDCIDSDNSHPKLFRLSEKKRIEISEIKEKVQRSTNDLKSKCEEICSKYDLNADPNSLDAFICKLFEAGFSSETNEWSRIAAKKEKTLKELYSELNKYLQEKSGLPIDYVAPIANELIDVYSKNPIVYKANTSRLFFSLFKNDKLDEYISTNSREFVLDTQILIQLCCVAFDGYEPTNADILYKVGRRFWEKVKENPKVKLFTTEEYVGEVSGHLCAANKLSRFLELDYIRDLGPSKNIFFNHYLTIKEESDYVSFYDYICQILDCDISIYTDDELQKVATNKLCDIFDELSIEVLLTKEIADYNKYKKEYDITLSSLGYNNRSYLAMKNDFHAVLWCGNRFDSFENTPYLITTDTSFVGIRNKMVDKFKDLSYWYVYTPQKISETLSLIEFKVEPDMIDDNIISLAESNFNTSNDSISFIDILNTFIDEKKLTDWKLATKLSRIRKIRISPVSDYSISVCNQPIDEFLSLLMELYTNRSTGYKFQDLKELFCNNDLADEIANCISNQLDSFKPGTSKLNDDIYIQFDKLIQEFKTINVD